MDNTLFPLVAKIDKRDILRIKQNPECETSLEQIEEAANGYQPLEALFAASGLTAGGYRMQESKRRPNKPCILKDGRCYEFPHWQTDDPIDFLLTDGFVDFFEVSDTTSVVFLSETDNGDLCIAANWGNDEWKDEVRALLQKPLDSAFCDILDTSGYIGNDWHVVRGEDIGALTDSPIIGYGMYSGDEMGEHEYWEKLWWFPDYMVKDPLMELLEKGEVVFSKAETWHDGDGDERADNGKEQEKEGESVFVYELTRPVLKVEELRLEFSADSKKNADAIAQQIANGMPIPAKWVTNRGESESLHELPTFDGEILSNTGPFYRVFPRITVWDENGVSATVPNAVQRGYVLMCGKDREAFLVPAGQSVEGYGDYVGIAVCEEANGRGSDCALAWEVKAGSLVTDTEGNTVKVVFLHRGK